MHYIQFPIFHNHLLPSDLMDYVTSGPVMAMELMRTDAVKHWRRILGPTDPLKARKDFPDSIRAKFGKDMTKNAAHGSDSLESAERVGDNTRIYNEDSPMVCFPFHLVGACIFLPLYYFPII